MVHMVCCNAGTGRACTCYPPAEKSKPAPKPEPKKDDKKK